MRRVLVTGMSGTGKSAEDRALILTHLREIERHLCATCTHELDATQPLGDVVAELVRIGADSG